MTLLERLARIATSDLPGGALVSDHDRISVADVREIMRLLATGEGWRRAYFASMPPSSEPDREPELEELDPG